jgi:cytochrome P450
VFERIKRAGYVFGKFESMLKARVTSRKAEITNGDPSAMESRRTSRDLFTRLLQANNTEGNGDLSLDAQEVLGNCFAFLFAGHGQSGALLLIILLEI